jgi:hypothetical protein
LADSQWDFDNAQSDSCWVCGRPGVWYYAQHRCLCDRHQPTIRAKPRTDDARPDVRVQEPSKDEHLVPAPEACERAPRVGTAPASETGEQPTREDTAPLWVIVSALLLAGIILLLLETV